MSKGIPRSGVRAPRKPKAERILDNVLSPGRLPPASLASPVRLPGGTMGPVSCLALLSEVDLSRLNQAMLPGMAPIVLAHEDWLALRQQRWDSGAILEHGGSVVPVMEALVIGHDLSRDQEVAESIAAILLRAWGLGFAAGRRFGKKPARKGESP
jgi:hypothetical protein